MALTDIITNESVVEENEVEEEAFQTPGLRARQS